MVASSCLEGPKAIIKYLMGVVYCGWCSSPHAFRLDGGQANHCNAGAVGVRPAVCPGVCVSEIRLCGAKSVGWVIVVVVLLGCFRWDVNKQVSIIP